MTTFEVEREFVNVRVNLNKRESDEIVKIDTSGWRYRTKI